MHMYILHARHERTDALMHSTSASKRAMCVCMRALAMPEQCKQRSTATPRACCAQMS